MGSRSCSLTPHRRAPCLAGESVLCCCRDTLPCEIWEGIGTLLLPDDSLGPLVYRERLNRLSRFSLACSSINSALGSTRKAAEKSLQHSKLRHHIWQVILDELLSDDLDVSSGHSTYFSVVCDFKDKPLLYYDGPEGKWVGTARDLCRELSQMIPRGSDTSEIVDEILKFDNLSILVTTCRDEPVEKLECEMVDAEEVQLFPLADSSINVIVKTIIDERHPWNVPEVFDFYDLAFKPMPEAAMLEYTEFMSPMR